MRVLNTDLTIKENKTEKREKNSGKSGVGATHPPARSVQSPPSVPALDLLLNNLSSIQESHQADKDLYFQQGLPFYTSINSLENTWHKEMPDGSRFEVQLGYDWKKDAVCEKLLKKLD